MNLFIINELYTNGFKIEMLNILSLFSILCGAFVIISKNPIISILFLIGLFGSISSYLILLGLNFIGLSYLIVYIGAISILFLFILMLINIRISELQNNTKNSILLAIFSIIFFNYSIFQLLPYDLAISNNISSIFNNILYYTRLNNGILNETKFINIKNNYLYFVTSNDWDTNLAETNHISTIGNILYTSHNIWLIITGFILLLAMVGAIVITIKNNNN